MGVHGGPLLNPSPASLACDSGDQRSPTHPHLSSSAPQPGWGPTQHTGRLVFGRDSPTPTEGPREATHQGGGVSAPRIQCSAPPAETPRGTQAGGAATLLEVGGPSGEGFARMKGRGVGGGGRPLGSAGRQGAPKGPDKERGPHPGKPPCRTSPASRPSTAPSGMVPGAPTPAGTQPITHITIYPAPTRPILARLLLVP